ncbi:MAG: Asp/Glu/hydantoin racemase [Candidatus Neomarinimicrobiota bacterium]
MKRRYFLTVLGLLLVSGCRQRPEVLPIVDDILTNQDSFFYLDAAAYPRNDARLPVGVFDSGTGGLTVLDAIVNFDGHDNGSHTSGSDGISDFQSEYFLYLGDQANMPYGNYSRENKLDLLQEHIIKDAQFLLGNKYYRAMAATEPATDKEPVKAIVIACNTATAYGKDVIEDFIARAGLELKIIGVIDAGVRAALDGFDQQNGGAVAVMATAGTVSSQGYVKALQQQWQAQGFAGEPIVFQQAGIGLAGAIDGSPEFIDPTADSPRTEYKGPAFDHPDAFLDPTILPRYGFDWSGGALLFEGTIDNPTRIQINSVPNYIAYHLVTLLEQVRRNGQSEPLKSIILGCTHYPFYTDLIRQNLARLYEYRENGEHVYRPFMAAEIDLIDPARNTAAELYAYLDEQQLFNQSSISHSEFYISVPNTANPKILVDQSGNFTYDYKYGRLAGQIQQYVLRVPFSRQTIPADVAQRLKTGIPGTWELIEGFNRGNPKLAGAAVEYLF